MARTESSVVVPLSPADAFDLLTDLERFDEWLVLHDGWPDGVPVREGLERGVGITSVLVVKGATAPFDWTVDELAPPRTFRFSGREKGIKVAVEFSVRPVDGGAEVTIALELGGLPMVGPVGKAAVKSLHPEIEESTQKFGALVGA